MKAKRDNFSTRHTNQFFVPRSKSKVMLDGEEKANRNMRPLEIP
jgi:hypothetical protein